jgi:hypothetical protein
LLRAHLGRCFGIARDQRVFQCERQYSIQPAFAQNTIRDRKAASISVANIVRLAGEEAIAATSLR